MRVIKVNLEKELAKLARGQQTDWPAEDVCAWALKRSRGLRAAERERAQRRDDVEFLERLYRLEDPRGA